MVHTARSARPAAPMRPVEAECPFCPFRDVLGDIVALHILQEHPEDGEAPFVLPEAANDAPNNGAFPAHNGGFPPFNPLDYADPATFLPEDLDADEAETTYMACPEDCGESVLLVDLQMHLDFHAAEQISMEDAQVGLDFEKKRQKRERSAANGYFSKPGRYLQSPESDRRKKEPKVTFIEASQQSSKGSKWMQKAALSITGAPYRTQSKAVTKSKMVHTPRLGASNLGPYANERTMPSWLYNELKHGGAVIKTQKIDPETMQCYVAVEIANETANLVPLIGELCELDPHVTKAWLCHPDIKHVGKQHTKEGGFCGYRNIQMLISYIQAAYPRGSHPFDGRIPTILKLQDMIEDGWNHGINVHGRIETGGIRGTRKYIGTSEAQTLFTNVSLRCTPHAFGRADGLATQHRLFSFVESYFSSASSTLPPPPASVPPPKITYTLKPPLYFQHSGHSMTIIGCSRHTDGTATLLVFDPFFTPATPMKRHAGFRSLAGRRLDPPTLLKAYRRGMDYLRKYKEFELITLEPPPEAGRMLGGAPSGVMSGTTTNGHMDGGGPRKGWYR